MRLHHVGIVVPDIDRAAGDFVSRLGYRLASGVIHDPVQTAKVQFLKLGTDTTFLELVSPDGPQSKLSAALKSGQRMHHLCFAVADIDAECLHMRDNGMVVIQEPVLAVAFPGRRIAWLLDRNKVLTELVEDGRDEWAVPAHTEPSID